jgi:hypothetical protein
LNWREKIRDPYFFRERIDHNRFRLNRPNLKQELDWAPHRWRSVEYDPIPYNSSSIKKLKQTLIDNSQPKFLSKSYRQNQHHPLWGYCYLFTQVSFYLLDTDVLQPYRTKYLLTNGQDDYHWWLVDKDTNDIIDFTADQFAEDKRSSLYSNGKRTGWLGFQPLPQSRTLDFISEIFPNTIRKFD